MFSIEYESMFMYTYVMHLFNMQLHFIVALSSCIWFNPQINSIFPILAFRPNFLCCDNLLIQDIAPFFFFSLPLSPTPATE